MQIIFGLGNPGEKYKQTRHNAGFLALDYLGQSHAVEIISEKKSFESLVKEIKLRSDPDDLARVSDKILLVYPLTFMNDSGLAARMIMDFYKLSPKDILVLHDDVDLELGIIRLIKDSGSAGHNGVNSIIERLGTKQFRRLRIGIESRQNKNDPPTESFVLQNFTTSELQKLPMPEIEKQILVQLRNSDAASDTPL